MGLDSFMARRYIDTAVYWGTPVADAWGKLQYADPIEIKCFWVEERKVVADKAGRDTVSMATIYVLIDLDDSGMLFHGTLDDLSAGEELDPLSVIGIYEIKAFVKMPGIDNKSFNRKAYLSGSTRIG